MIKNWDSRWFAKDAQFGDLLVEDYNIRKYLKKRLYAAGVPAIEIERSGDKLKLIIQCSRPGMVIGRGGADIEKLRADLAAMLGRTVESVRIDILEIKNPIPTPSWWPRTSPSSWRREFPSAAR